MSNFLFEIGLEELPAHVVSPSAYQLREKFAKFLAENNLDFADIDVFATPRRLAVRVNGLSDKQADVSIEEKGPAREIIEKNPGAGIGFAKKFGLAVEDIEYREVGGKEYAYLNNFVAGKTAAEVLAGGIIDVAKSLTFPVSMTWADNDFAYIRPIHWFVALLDSEVVDVEFLGVKSGRTTRGHRFLGHDIEIDHADNYEAKLNEVFVIASLDERKQIITDQINKLATGNGFVVDIDAKLLEEVNNIVEWPTAFVGDFEAGYLDLPSEVLITSMKEHQRYFEVYDADGNLVNHFITVRNGNEHGLENVKRGNEKVLVARLEDAEFFWAEDQKLTIETCVSKLSHVTFHEKIGTLSEKMARTKIIALALGRALELSDSDLLKLGRAADIYKFDLVTNMVGEFDELQGIIGEKYALIQGEDVDVARAIVEHYLPLGAESDLPESVLGSVLAFADKLESVISFFSVDLVPTGSNDPFALRRAAYAVVRLILAKGYDLDFAKFLNEVYGEVNAGDFGTKYANVDAVIDFVKARIDQVLKLNGTRVDVRAAVINSSAANIGDVVANAKLVEASTSDAEAMQAITRILNIVAKHEGDFARVTPSLFQNDSEKALYDATYALAGEFLNADKAAAFTTLIALKPVITDYFDNTMVNDDDAKIKENRYAQLKVIADIAKHYADFSELVIK
ncbi:MAG: glycine--tRNA ligase subunit beta [Lactobacillales bacterium]|jgi:glycyl-tRNA synthetase beta chain|nr:glycine--tRNA ligase subunit beta [Lactobacillales bacterium]